MSSNQYYRTLAKHFCPVFYLHSSEHYFPCPVEYVITHCQLHYNATTDLFDGISVHDTPQRLQILSTVTTGNQPGRDGRYRMKIAEHTWPGYTPYIKPSPTSHQPSRPATPQYATTQQHNHISNQSEDAGVNVNTVVDNLNGVNIQLQPTIPAATNTTATPQQPPPVTDFSQPQPLSHAPVYVQIRRADIDTTRYIDIVYHVYCAYNGPFSICGVVVQQSAHESDYEHVTVRVDISGVEPVVYAVYFSQHGDHDGQWLMYDQLEYEVVNGERHVVVYPAMHGHSMHHKAGTYVVAMGVANEYCDRGHRWYPRDTLVMLTDTEDAREVSWLSYYGLWEPTGTDSLKCKAYWWHSEPVASNSRLRRVVFGNRLNYTWLFNKTLQANA